MNDPIILEDFCLLFLINSVMRHNRGVMREYDSMDESFREAQRENAILRREKFNIFNRTVATCKARSEE